MNDLIEAKRLLAELFNDTDILSPDQCIALGIVNGMIQERMNKEAAEWVQQRLSLKTTLSF